MHFIKACKGVKAKTRKFDTSLIFYAFTYLFVHILNYHHRRHCMTAVNSDKPILFQI